MFESESKVNSSDILKQFILLKKAQHPRLKLQQSMVFSVLLHPFQQISLGEVRSLPHFIKK